MIEHGKAARPGRAPATPPGTSFRVSDGTVARGPATAPQPAFRTRIADGTLQACLRGAGWVVYPFVRAYAVTPDLDVLNPDRRPR